MEQEVTAFLKACVSDLTTLSGGMMEVEAVDPKNVDRTGRIFAVVDTARMRVNDQKGGAVGSWQLSHLDCEYLFSVSGADVFRIPIV